MLFKRQHVQPILEGKKTQTRRLWDRCHVKVGRIYKARTHMLSRDFFAKLRVTAIRVGTLKDEVLHISRADAKAEGYATPSDYVKAFKDIYVNWSVTESFPVHVITFELV